LKATKTDTAIGICPIGQTPFFQEENFLTFVVNCHKSLRTYALLLAKLSWNKSSWPWVEHCQTIVSLAKMSQSFIMCFITLG